MNNAADKPTEKPRLRSRGWFLEQAEEAKVSRAKQALACPGLFTENRVPEAIRQYRMAVFELKNAKAAWLALIGPAKGWAPDPYADMYPEGF